MGTPSQLAAPRQHMQGAMCRSVTEWGGCIVAFLVRRQVRRNRRQQVEGQRDELLHRRLSRHQDRTRKCFVVEAVSGLSYCSVRAPTDPYLLVPSLLFYCSMSLSLAA